MDLSSLREKINKIDSELLFKLKERMEISKEIGIFKKENNLEVLDSKREELLINSLINHDTKVFEDDKNKEFITDLWKVIMNYSKSNQNLN
tara:strand:- start:704 stop:976 length:273 start_codon:yes stop_codon:yes gene_type:complete